MIWNKKLPKWKAPGVEPPEELKENGFVAGYKPPAPYFNWLFFTIYEAIREIRSELKEVSTTGKASDLKEDEKHRFVTDKEKEKFLKMQALLNYNYDAERKMLIIPIGCMVIDKTLIISELFDSSIDTENKTLIMPELFEEELHGGN